MACTYYRFENSLFGGDYWCDKENRSVDSDSYYRYCRGYNYSTCPIYRHNESSGCFITTVCCQILKFPDNCQFLNDFRTFRDEVLTKNSKYYDILKEYDNVGPMIATAIYQDKEKNTLAQGLYQNALLKIHKDIKAKQNDSAVEKYYIMTLMLINYYGLKHKYNKIKDDSNYGLNFIPETSGHGRVKKVSN